VSIYGTSVSDFSKMNHYMPVALAERSEARVYGRSFAGIAGSNPSGGMDGCPLWLLCVVR
jgi:hypothetical protein